MRRGEGACLVCGKPLTYFETARTMKCVFCRREFESHASCEDGHFVCDACHAATALQAIGDIGGPTCCKRNSFTAVREATVFVREKLGVAMELPEKITCTYSGENKQCLRTACPYHWEGTK